MEGGIAAAVGEILRLRQVDLHSRLPRIQLTRAITAIDHALEELEQINLADCSRLPEGVAAHVSLLVEAVPLELRPSVSAHGSVEYLMNDLYRSQHFLLIQRSGQEWDTLRESDDELLPSA